MTKEQRDALLYQPKNGYDRLTQAEEQELNAYCEAYKSFLDRSKTERECVFTAILEAEARGFVAYHPGMPIKTGDKLYWNNRGKAIMLAVIGEEDLSHGANIGAAHTDAPRLDIKPNPLYEDSELAYLKTHHYGGIRKYQWVTVPLELHGKIVRRDGSEVYVTIGNDPSDPQLVITDLLPHLGREQGKKPLNEAIPSESLNILMGSRPEADDDGKDRVKLSVLRLLNEKYGIVEEDFISAELEAVPAANARDIGLDRSMIGAYGHDDRVCAYAELAAIFDAKSPERLPCASLRTRRKSAPRACPACRVRRSSTLWSACARRRERTFARAWHIPSACPPMCAPRLTRASPRSSSARTPRI